MADIHRMENDRLDGRYIGTITVPEVDLMVFNATFDGTGSFSGKIEFNSTFYIFENQKYFVNSNVTQFSIILPDSQLHWIFIGDISPDDFSISGDIQFRQGNSDIFNGSFTFTAVL